MAMEKVKMVKANGFHLDRKFHGKVIELLFFSYPIRHKHFNMLICVKIYLLYESVYNNVNDEQMTYYT